MKGFRPRNVVSLPVVQNCTPRRASRTFAAVERVHLTPSKVQEEEDEEDDEYEEEENDDDDE